MKNIQEDSRLVDDNSDLNDSKNNISINNEEIALIFRNPASKDTTLNINLSKIHNISNLSEELLSKLGKTKLESNVRFFFKGRPLKNEEKIKDLGNNNLNLENNIFINYSSFQF